MVLYKFYKSLNFDVLNQIMTILIDHSLIRPSEIVQKLRSLTTSYLSMNWHYQSSLSWQVASSAL